MDYKILEAHIQYTDGILTKVCVLWQPNSLSNYVRATYLTNLNTHGYGSIATTDLINDSLLQKVAAFGMNLPDSMKSKLFPGKKNWSH